MDTNDLISSPARRLARRAIPALVLAACALLWLQPRPARAAPPAVAAAAASDERDDAPPGRKATSGKLNLNTATPEQLELLPGVGPAKAERIIAFRQKHGPFKRVADLRRVKGFGRKTLKKLEPFLDVKGETTLAAPND